MVEVVADRGLHGASMSLVARQAGVATGTAYVHYESKDALLIAAFVEVKSQLGRAAMAGVDPAAEPRLQFGTIWKNCHAHMTADPPIAHFLLQVEASPLKDMAHEATMEDDLTRAAEAMSAFLVDLPVDVLYDLSLAPAVRLVASGTELDDPDLETLIEACWRAVHKP